MGSGARLPVYYRSTVAALDLSLQFSICKMGLKKMMMIRVAMSLDCSKEEIE